MIENIMFNIEKPHVEQNFPLQLHLAQLLLISESFLMEQGQLMQMTMMTPPNFNSELHYLNKEDRLLRWLLVKHRDVKFGGDFLNEDDGSSDLRMIRSSIYDVDSEEDEDDDDEEVTDTVYQEQKNDA
ncbi:hypothetical protein Tco_1269393 [Tanacetum coccineum]